MKIEHIAECLELNEYHYKSVRKITHFSFQVFTKNRS